MFEYVCDRVIPGCTHRETGETPEEVREKASTHIEGHHGGEHREAPTQHEIDLAILRSR